MNCCFSDAPVTQNEIEKSDQNAEFAKFLDNTNTFQIKMADAPFEECCYWLYGTLPFTCLCAQMQTRYEVLNHVHPGSKWNEYYCCQGMFGDCLCFRPGKMGEENCPACCLCLEVACCPGAAVSATRFVMMKQYHLALDPCDNRIIRCNNALQGCLVILSVINACGGGNSRTKDLENLLRCIANVVYLTTQGCMLAQVHRELKVRGATEPEYQRMEERD